MHAIGAAQGPSLGHGCRSSTMALSVWECTPFAPPSRTVHCCPHARHHLHHCHHGNRSAFQTTPTGIRHCRHRHSYCRQATAWPSSHSIGHQASRAVHQSRFQACDACQPRSSCASCCCCSCQALLLPGAPPRPPGRCTATSTPSTPFHSQWFNIDLGNKGTHCSQGWMAVPGKCPPRSCAAQAAALHALRSRSLDRPHPVEHHALECPLSGDLRRHQLLSAIQAMLGQWRKLSPKRARLTRCWGTSGGGRRHVWWRSAMPERASSFP